MFLKCIVCCRPASASSRPCLHRQIRKAVLVPKKSYALENSRLALWAACSTPEYVCAPYGGSRNAGHPAQRPPWQIRHLIFFASFPFFDIFSTTSTSLIAPFSFYSVPLLSFLSQSINSHTSYIFYLYPSFVSFSFVSRSLPRLSHISILSSYTA